jgi:glycosyltransferase involved in cell wall biosynthesis
MDGLLIFRPRFLYAPRVIKPGRIYDLFYSWAVQRTVKSMVRLWQPDLVVSDWIVPCGFAGYRISNLLDIPLVLRARGADVRTMKKLAPKLADYYRMIGERSDYIFCNGFGLKQDLIRINIFDENKLRVMPNGIDTDVFHPANNDERISARKFLRIPMDAQVWVFIGTWDHHKGSSDLANVLPGLFKKNPAAYFIEAGPIIDSASCQSVKSLGDQVQFLGMVNTDQVIRCFHASDIFILPSHYEGLPNALLEAMACGLTSIASTVGGIPQIVVNGKNGILIEPGNVVSLEAGIQRCAKDEQIRQSIGREARRSIVENGFDMRSVAKEWCTIFLGCLHKSG